MTNLKIIAASLTATAMVAIPAVSAKSVSAEEQTTKGQVRLAKMLEGRVAGDPQSCIPIRPTTNVTVIDETALVYKVGRTLYVNVPDNAKSIDEDDTLVRRTSLGSQLCNTEIVTTRDRFHGNFTGSINLGQFVPYRKAAS